MLVIPHPVPAGLAVEIQDSPRLHHQAYPAPFPCGSKSEFQTDLLTVAPSKSLSPRQPRGQSSQPQNWMQKTENAETPIQTHWLSASPHIWRVYAPLHPIFLLSSTLNETRKSGGKTSPELIFFGDLILPWRNKLRIKWTEKEEVLLVSQILEDTACLIHLYDFPCLACT